MQQYGLNYKSITLNERSQIQKAIYNVVLFIWHFTKGKTIGFEISGFQELRLGNLISFACYLNFIQQYSISAFIGLFFLVSNVYDFIYILV